MAASRSLSALLSEASLDDHEELLRAANAALKQSKTDSQAQRARLVALLKLDRFEEALDALEEAGDSLKKEARLEHAYALYKDGQWESAQAVASAGDGRRGLKHVEAQVAYRREQFPRTAELYKEISQGRWALEQESADIRINRGATDAQLAWAGQIHLVHKTKPDRQDLEQFETAFNAACGYVAQGDLKQASFLLSRAKDLCNAADELSEDDKKAELLPITVQQVYVLSRLGQHSEAEKLCSDVNINDISDPATRHIARTNELFLSPALNPYKAHRMFHETSKIDAKDRPFRFQALALRQDSSTLDLKAGKTTRFSDPAPGRSTTKTEHSPELDPSSGVFVAASRAQTRIGKGAIKSVLPLLEKHPDDVGLLLTVIQLYLLKNQMTAATALLESFLVRLEQSSNADNLDVRFAPGLVALLVALYSRQNRTANTKAELAKASAYWRHKSKSARGPADSLLRAAGVALLNQPTAQDTASAHEIFQLLSQQDASDRVAVAGLAASSQDMKDGPRLEKALPGIEKLTEGVDAAELEEAGVAKPTPPAPAAQGKKRGMGEAATKPKAKRSRPAKTPKNFDADKQPDPERWLPLRDRSNWRPKGKKKRRAGGGGMATQGGIVNDDSRPSTPGQGQQQQQQQQQQQTRQGGQAQTKKKKGKGK